MIKPAWAAPDEPLFCAAVELLAPMLSDNFGNESEEDILNRAATFFAADDDIVKTAVMVMTQFLSGAIITMGTTVEQAVMQMIVAYHMSTEEFE